MSPRDRIAGVLTRHHAAGTWETADAIITELHAGGIALVPEVPPSAWWSPPSSAPTQAITATACPTSRFIAPWSPQRRSRGDERRR